MENEQPGWVVSRPTKSGEDFYWIDIPTPATNNLHKPITNEESIRKVCPTPSTRRIVQT